MSFPTAQTDRDKAVTAAVYKALIVWDNPETFDGLQPDPDQVLALAIQCIQWLDDNATADFKLSNADAFCEDTASWSDPD